MTRALTGLVVLLATSALAGEAELLLSVQSEARGRSALPGDLGQGATSDVELLPALLARLGASPFLLEVGYRPSFVFRDLVGQGPFLPLHRAHASVQWVRTQTLVRVSAEGARGVVDLGPLLVLDGAPVGQLNSTTSAGLVDYLRGVATLTVEQRFSPSIMLGGEASYDVSGSPTSVALPLQWGPSGALRLRWDDAQADHFITALVARHADFITGHRQTIVEATQGWARQLLRPLLVEVVAGVAVVEQAVPATGVVPAVKDLSVMPVITGAATYVAAVRGSKLELKGRAGLAPFADRFTATVYERLGGSVGLTWTFHVDLVAAVVLSAARSFPSAVQQVPADYLLAAESSVAWSAQPWLVVGAALRAAHVEVLGSNGSSQDQWLASVSLTLRDREHTSWR